MWGYGKGKNGAYVCIWCMTEHNAMQTYGGVKILLHMLLSSVLEGGDWLAVYCKIRAE